MSERICIAGASSQVDTSVVVLGLLVALKQLGVNAAISNIGPSLTEPTQYRRVSGRLSVSLDPWLLSKEQLISSFVSGTGAADFVILESGEGLYDFFPTGGAFKHRGEVASGLGAPVVLVIDAAGFEESFAAVVRGYESAGKLAGVIALNIKDENHNERLKKVVTSFCRCSYLGGISEVELQEIQYGKRRGTQYVGVATRAQLLSLGTLLSSSIDVPAISKLAQEATPIEASRDNLKAASQICRIAVADDAAFHATYHNNLELLRRFGAELSAFSPLADIKLPPGCKAVYIPGGHLHQYAADLQNNEVLRAEIREFAQRGGAIYAEGAGAAYLAESYEIRGGNHYEMVGVLPGVVRAASVSRSIPLNYCQVNVTTPSLLSPADVTFRAVRDSRWEFDVPAKVPRNFTISELNPNTRAFAAEFADGYSPLPHVLATSITGHWGSAPELAKYLVDSANTVAKHST